MSDVRGKSATAMSRTKKPSKLSADERAFLNRIRSLNEEETKKLTFEELIAYWNIMHKIDPRSVRHAFEERKSARNLSNSRPSVSSFLPASAHFGARRARVVHEREAPILGNHTFHYDDPEQQRRAEQLRDDL